MRKRLHRGVSIHVGLRDDEILMVGKDDKRLKAPGDSVEEYAQFSIFGLSNRLVLVITEYKRQYMRFFDGENWLKSYLPVIPVFDGCKYSRGGITFRLWQLCPYHKGYVLRTTT